MVNGFSIWQAPGQPPGPETELNLPNAISLSRILAVPIVIWLIISDRMAAAFWLFLAAAISDAVDGVIAKKFNQTTTLGGYLDPIADKVLLTGSYVAMAVHGFLPVWLVIFVVARDAVIVIGAFLYHLMTRDLHMEPIRISKINTVAQLVLAVAILAGEGLGFELGMFLPAMTFLVAVTTVLSGAVYVIVWSRKALRRDKIVGNEVGE